MTELDRQIALLLELPVAGTLAAQLATLSVPTGTGNIPFCLAMRRPPIAAVMERSGAEKSR